MPIHVVVEDERGGILSELEPGSYLLPVSLPSPDDKSYICLRFVDPYGDTVFNRAQIPIVIEELKRLRQSSGSEKNDRLYEKLIELSERCQAMPHRYLRFIGD